MTERLVDVAADAVGGAVRAGPERGSGISPGAFPWPVLRTPGDVSAQRALHGFPRVCAAAVTSARPRTLLIVVMAALECLQACAPSKLPVAIYDVMRATVQWIAI